VIIPNYNRVDLIGETLKTILNQTRPPEEVIVVDDGSTDGSIDLLRTFEPRIRVITQTNAGPGAARNRGFAAARGRYIQFFDSDDLCALNKIEVQLAALESTGADVAYSPWLQAQIQDGLALYRQLPLQQRPLPARHPPEFYFVRSWVTVFQPCLFRREVLERAGPFREDLKPSEDSELLFRVLLSGAKLVHVPDTLVLYRVHPSNQISGSALGSRARAADWLKYTKHIMKAIYERPDRFSRLDQLVWLAEVAFARRQVKKLSGAESKGEEGSFRSRFTTDMLATFRVLRSGLERRLARSGFKASYQTGPLQDSQISLLRQIGYEPRRAF
jgi:glycosyltransferase involved in cell wall biosynthesis